MRRIRGITGVLVAAGLAFPVAAQRSTHDFEGHKVSLELPPGYILQADPSPRPGLKTIGFSTDARSDGTRGMIQVSLVDLSQAPPRERPTLERFATTMIGGVRQRRSRWEQTESEIKIAGVRAKRIEWAGSSEPGFGRPPINMRGVMIVGIKKDLGFSLHTQDVVAFADTTLQVCEEALHSFTATLRR